MIIEPLLTDDLLVKFGIGGACLWFALQVFDRVFSFLSQKKDEKTEVNSGSKPPEFWISQFREIIAEEIRQEIHTFASQPDAYWRNMDTSLEKSVTKPLADILIKQTEILEKLADHAAEERGRRDR